MRIEIDPHALMRAQQRGTNEEEIRSTIAQGERFSAKEGRVGFRRNFPFAKTHNGRYYQTIQLIVIAQEKAYGWLAITVITQFF